MLGADAYAVFLKHSRAIWNCFRVKTSERRPGGVDPRLRAKEKTEQAAAVSPIIGQEGVRINFPSEKSGAGACHSEVVMHAPKTVPPEQGCGVGVESGAGVGRSRL